MDTADDALNRLFQAYRRACPDPEPGADFMPGVWRRIEARRKFTLSLRRWTSAFVTASAALCVAMSLYVGSRAQPESPLVTTTYVETLQTEDLETIAYADLVTPDTYPVVDPEVQ